jgi:hypothetical protein
MINRDEPSAKEVAFLEQLEKHENEWVAFIDGTDGETIVGAGRDAIEAMQEARANGFPNAILLKVPRFDRAYILPSSRLPNASFALALHPGNVNTSQ